MAADITTGAGINSGIPRELFDTGLIVNQAVNEGGQYAVTSDGRRFLLLKPLAEATSTPITVVLNWISLLKK